MSDSLIQRVDAALPIEDIVGWLVQQFPDATERDVLGMVQEVYAGDYEIGPSERVERTYSVGENTWTACPQRVAARPN